uniref:Uncharacterized protein n=1 Tax=Kalanchoe fedtschenkoi TaxID=63787 RepID=A0A7N0UEP4_KALFE
MMNTIRTALGQRGSPSINLHRGAFTSLFSTEADGISVPKFSADSFTHGPGVFYGSLVGSIKNTLRSDVVNLLDGSDLTLEDVKTVYSPNFMPLSILVKFPSFKSYDKALKLITKNRLYRLDKADPSQWDRAKDYGGKTLLLEGIPRLAQLEEVERFLSGCEYDAASMIMFTRQAFPEPIKTAVVPVSSPTQATSIFLRKNRGYISNNQVLVRVLQ